MPDLSRMNHFPLDFIEIFQGFFKFHKVILNQTNINWLDHRKFWGIFEQSKHLSVV